MKNIENVDEIISSCFGLWISALFSAISGWNPGISFADQKEAFFGIVEYLLKIGKIKFIDPGIDCYISSNNPSPRFTIYDMEARWQAPAEKIISYLRERWPAAASEETDLDLVIYFYEIPGVIWVHDSGQLVAS